MEKGKILIIEDEFSLRHALLDRFQKEGFDVSLAENGEEGLEVAEKLRPDVILLDILMPKKNGIEMLRELRDADWGKDIYVIILTNAGDDGHVAEAMMLGTHDYFVKADLKLEDIVEKVKEGLGRR